MKYSALLILSVFLAAGHGSVCAAGPVEVDTNAVGVSVHKAVWTNDLCALSRILEEDRNAANATVRGGVTPLHLAAAMNRKSAAGILLACGAEVNARTDTGFTPLHWAACRDSARAADLLILMGADVSATASNGPPAIWL
ncbi:MAG: ankyrin repeat domain-containing protein [Kiritimatiellia bacterium]